MNDNKQRLLAALAVVLIILAAAIFYWNYQASQPEMVKTTPQDIQKEIERIQNDPNMPPQAKAVAIQELRAHTGGQQPNPR